MDEQRTAIVTGAGKRIGADVVSALLERGWTVLAHVRREEDKVPAGALAVAADLDSPDCAERIFAAAKDRPPVRLLVNNAARFAWDSLGEFSPEEFDSHMHVNVRSPVLLMEALAKRHAGGDALVVNILDSKLAAPNADFLSYTLSKYALAGLTEMAARALAMQGIRVNAIAPALMLPSGEQDEPNFAAVHDLNPLRRGVRVTDVIAALRLLIDSPTMTGQTLVLDGGQRFMALPRDVQFLSPSGDGQFLEAK